MDELIRRSDAIKAIEALAIHTDERYLNDLEYGHNEGLAHAIDRIEDIPSADRWIPCTEREPNEFEDVLVLFSDGTMDVLQLTDYLDIWGNVKWCHTANYGMGYSVSGNDVVAWMPLPEPWKGAENSKECHKPQSLYYRAFCEERKDSAYCDGCEFWY